MFIQLRLFLVLNLYDDFTDAEDLAAAVNPAPADATAHEVSTAGSDDPELGHS